MDKHCRTCKQTKSFDQFNRDNQRKDGYYPSCKACVKAYNAERASQRLASVPEKTCADCGQIKPATHRSIVGTAAEIMASFDDDVELLNTVQGAIEQGCMSFSDSDGDAWMFCVDAPS